jgi:replicative DNA helicase
MAIPMTAGPDEALLGLILRDNRQYHVVADILSSADFAQPRLGAVYDGIAAAIVSGQKVDQFTIETMLPEWGILGIGPNEPYEWADVPTAWSSLDALRIARTMEAQSIRRRAREVMTQALHDLGEAGKNPAQVVADATRHLVVTPRAAMESTTLREVLLIPDVYDWVIPGLMERMDRLILTGHEGHGKTTLVRQLLISAAAGIHPFTLAQFDPIRVLAIDAENTARQWMRASRWMVNLAIKQAKVDPSPNVRMALSGRINLLDPLILGGIHRLIDEHKPDIVFIGPLYRLAVQMNNDEQIAPVIAALDAIRDRGVALIIEAHAGHATGPGGVRDVRPRGSSALMGWPEFGFGLRAAPIEEAGENVYDFVAWRGSREERDWPRQVRRGDWQMGDWPWVAVAEWA